MSRKPPSLRGRSFTKRVDAERVVGLLKERGIKASVAEMKLHLYGKTADGKAACAVRRAWTVQVARDDEARAARIVDEANVGRK